MPDLQWYLRRLSLMSAGEVGHRVSHAARARLEQVGLGLARRAPPDVRAMTSGLGRIPAAQVADVRPYLQEARESASGVGRVLSIEDATFGPEVGWNRDPGSGVVGPLSFGKAIDYRDERLVGDIKYVWEPNRHLHLPAMAQAAVLSGDRAYAMDVHRHVSSWIAQCPYPNGPNWASSLEIGIRLINWSWTWRLLGGAEGLIREWGWHPEWIDQWLESIHAHQHFCFVNYSAHSSANNHLIGEAAGAYVAAQTWPFWRESPDWRRRAKAILEQECQKQTASDGVNREQATSYQLFVFELLVCAGIVAAQAGDRFSREFWGRLAGMMHFVATLYARTGGVPQIGDADDALVLGLAPGALERQVESDLHLAAELFDWPEFRQPGGLASERAAWMLGGLSCPVSVGHVHPDVIRRHGPFELVSFEQGGLDLLNVRTPQGPNVALLFDSGPLGYLSIAAHGHADALSALLWIDDLEFLIDPGTFAYHTQPAWRAYFRGTAAHNTITVDGLDQSLPGGNFMWMRHGNAICTVRRVDEGGVTLSGEHDGYHRLKDPVTHARSVSISADASELVVTDVLRCDRTHQADIRWHFSDRCAVRIGDGGVIVAERDGWRVELRPLGFTPDAVLLRGSTTPVGGWISRRFGVKHPCPTVSWVAAVAGLTTFRTEVLVSRIA